MTFHEPGMPFVDESTPFCTCLSLSRDPLCACHGDARLPVTAFGVWIETSTCLPPAGTPVLVTLQTPRPCVILAQYAPKKTLPMHPECNDERCCDYDEERDEYYAAEGWYQCYAVNGQLDSEPYWRLHDEVSHWTALPLPAGRLP